MKKLFEKLDIKNIGYIVNKKITNIAFLILAIYFVLGMFTYSINPLEVSTYSYCPNESVGGKCFNSLYDDGCVEYGSNYTPIMPFNEIHYETECPQPQFILAGESIGKPPVDNPFVDSFITFMMCVLILALSYNHSKYNKGFKFRGKNENNNN